MNTTRREQKEERIGETPETVQEMVRAATAFLGSLEPDQRRQTVFAVNDEQRLRWDYRPVVRQGLPFSGMDTGQRLRALALLASGLSQRGTMTALQIMSLETVLGALEGGLGHHQRDPARYFVSIFGTPRPESVWGWRLEGHHLSVNVLVAGDRIACTPSFFGANPARVPTGPLTGFLTLPREEAAARQLMSMLDEHQVSHAVISDTAPPDIISGWAPRIRRDDPAGLAVSALTTVQRQAALRLIDVYLGRMAPPVAEQLMAAIDRQGIGTIHFAWAGSQRPGEPHYYRLHGPAFLVEYDNSQDGANHIHSVWRDPERDWGDDLLRAHYARAHTTGTSS